MDGKYLKPHMLKGKYTKGEIIEIIYNQMPIKMIIKLNLKIQRHKNIQIINIKKITIIQVQAMIDQVLVHIHQKLPIILQTKEP